MSLENIAAFLSNWSALSPLRRYRIYVLCCLLARRPLPGWPQSPATRPPHIIGDLP